MNEYEATRSDPTEAIRRVLVEEINVELGSREALEAEHGKVWDTKEVSADFTVHSFLAPFVIVTEKATRRIGTLMFQHSPRLYFSFTEDK